MVGLQVLVLTIGVRIPGPEPRKAAYAATWQANRSMLVCHCVGLFVEQ